MFGVPIVSILILLGLCSFGYAGHVLWKVAELRDNDPTITLSKYFSINPYRTIGKLVLVLGAVVGLAEPVLTPLSAVGAIGIGYGADSAGNHLLKGTG